MKLVEKRNYESTYAIIIESRVRIKFAIGLLSIFIGQRLKLSLSCICGSAAFFVLCQLVDNYGAYFIEHFNRNMS